MLAKEAITNYTLDIECNGALLLLFMHSATSPITQEEVVRLHLPHAIVVRLHTLYGHVVIPTQETAGTVSA